MKSKLIFLSGCLLILLMSCKKNSYVVKTKYSGDKPEEKMSDFQYLTSKARLLIDGNKAKVNIRMKKDSLIWMSVTASVGIEVARIQISKDSIQFINRDEENYSVYNYDALSKHFNFKINYDIIQSFIIGDMPNKNYDQEDVIKEKDYFVIKQNDGIISTINYIDKSNMKLVKLLMTENTSDNKLKLTYKRFAAINQMLFPQFNFVSIQYKDKEKDKSINSEISIEHYKIIISNEAVKFPFKIPQSYIKKEQNK